MSRCELIGLEQVHTEGARQHPQHHHSGENAHSRQDTQVGQPDAPYHQHGHQDGAEHQSASQVGLQED